jgi:4a-hydroxytetrahydrobiopterin dehydratase
MSLLPDDEVAAFVEEHADWSWSDQSISRTYGFPGFSEAIAFVDRVAEAAEAADHHPDIDIRWNKVTLVLSTHSAGGITAKDLELAQQADGLVTG